MKNINKTSFLSIFPLRLFKHRKAAFTLIELLVVVLIIGILAAIAVPQYQKAVEKSRAVEALLSIKALAQSSQRYELEHGTLPLSLDDLDIETPKATKNWWIETSDFGNYITAYNKKDQYVRISYNRRSSKIFCNSQKDEPKGRALCKSLGGYEATPPVTSCGWKAAESCLVLAEF